MSDGINKASVLGFVGADSELKTTDKGSALKFSIATTESWLDKDKNRQERTEWHNIVVFGKRGESLVHHIKKGSKMYIGGRLSTHSYEKDGQKKYFTEIVADDVVFAGGRPSANGAYSPTPPPKSQEIAAPF